MNPLDLNAPDQAALDDFAQYIYDLDDGFFPEPNDFDDFVNDEELVSR